MKFLLASILAVAACGGGSTPPGDDTPPADDTPPGDDNPDTPDAPPAAQNNRVHMAFGVTNGVRASPNLHDPLMGPAYGQLFKSSEVTLTGPIDGATEYGSIMVTSLDLVTAQMAGDFLSEPLPANDYTFLGYFDVDNNGAASQSPDAGDPVTIPITNTFTITDGQAAPVEMTVMFDFVYN